MSGRMLYLPRCMDTIMWQSMSDLLSRKSVTDNVLKDMVTNRMSRLTVSFNVCYSSAAKKCDNQSQYYSTVVINILQFNLDQNYLRHTHLITKKTCKQQTK